MEPLEYPELTDHNLTTFADKWEPWDRLVVTKCIKEIKPKHIRHLASHMRKLKFTNLNTFKNLKTLLNYFTNVHTLLFHDACFDKFRPNKLEKMVYHETITHIVITSTTTLSTKEHWIIEFLMEEVNFPNLVSLRIQKFYSRIPLQGEVQEIMKKYNNEIDDNLVTKFLLKNRHCLRELELGGPGLKMAISLDPGLKSKGRPSHDQDVMTDVPVYQASAVQYDQIVSTSKGLQYEEEKKTTEVQYEFENTLTDAQTEDFKRPLEKFIARLKARKEKDERLKNSSMSAATIQELYVSQMKDDGFNSLNSIISLLTSKSETKLQKSWSSLPSIADQVPDETTVEPKTSGPNAKDTASVKKIKPESTESITVTKKKKHRSRSQKESSSSSEESDDEKSSKSRRNKHKPSSDKMQKTLTDFEKIQTLNLETFIFSFDAPASALKSVMESQRTLKVLMCTHVFVLQGMFNINSPVDIENVTSSITTCVRNCEETLNEVTVDPTMVIDASHETLKETNYLRKRVNDLGIPSLAILMGTKVTSLQRIPSFQLEELSLSLEDYSRDEFEKFAKTFGSFIKLRRFYFGTSTLKPENTFMIR
ncbi:unnamed protein product [Allacma fusca]|uniref:Uncharacterized protein n=1 Tax=Allacma fusca TaxID=39272 RepID=A0A8J2JTP3_9HEXA|nr:unnamed protein product [Allacma fusca]